MAAQWQHRKLMNKITSGSSPTNSLQKLTRLNPIPKFAYVILTRQNSYVSVVGEAEVVTDPAKIKELWNPTLKAWFPKGLDDPKLALLKVKALSAEYWDATSSTMQIAYNMVKSTLTGHYDQGDHGKVDLQ